MMSKTRPRQTRRVGRLLRARQKTSSFESNSHPVPLDLMDTSNVELINELLDKDVEIREVHPH